MIRIRSSLGGSLLLLTYLYAAATIFDSSYYGLCLRSGSHNYNYNYNYNYHAASSSSSSYSSAALNAIVMATSLASALGHAAVVLGALGDASILAIAAGVAFDGATRALQLIWWMQLSVILLVGMGRGYCYCDYDDDDADAASASSQQQQQQHQHQHEIGTIAWKDAYGSYRMTATICFLGIQSIGYVYHLPIHLRVLRTKYNSYGEVASMVCAALNNLRGNVHGRFVTANEIFAISNLGGHAVPLYLSSYLLHRQRWFGSWSCISMLLAVAAIACFALYRIPTLLIDDEINDDGAAPLVISVKGGKIDCRCRACSKRYQTTGEYSSFTFRIERKGFWMRNGGVCCLWLRPFEELSDTLLKLAFHAE